MRLIYFLVGLAAAAEVRPGAHSPQPSHPESATRNAAAGGDDEEREGGPRLTSLSRVDVHFAKVGGGVDFNQLIGRKAHIDFLETDEYVRFLIWKLRRAFL